MNTKTFLISVALIIAILVGYYGYLRYQNNKNSTNTTTDIATLADPNSIQDPTLQQNINYVLPSGEQSYNVSHGKEAVGPRMSQIVYSPLAIESGQTQKIKVVFPEKEVVGSVVLFINTDTKENQKVTLKKESKTNNWVGEWIPEDTVKTRYSIKIVAVGSAGEYNNVMTFL